MTPRLTKLLGPVQTAGERTARDEAERQLAAVTVGPECRCHVLGTCDRQDWHSEVFDLGLHLIDRSGPCSDEYLAHIRECIERDKRRAAEKAAARGEAADVYRTPRYTFHLADGRTVTGVVHGSGGVLHHPRDIEVIQASIERAEDDDELRIYEPKPGHVRVYPHYSAYGQGEPIDVDLRGATVERAKEGE